MENINQSPDENKVLSKKELKKVKKENKKLAKAEEKNNKGKNSKGNKKDILLPIFLVVLAVVLFVICSNTEYECNVTGTINIINMQTPAATVTPDENISSTPTVQPTDVSAPVIENKEPETTQAVESTTPSALTDAQILDIITKGINSLKTDDVNYKGTQIKDINIWLNTCSVPSLTEVINKFIKTFIGENVNEFDFVNGTDSASGTTAYYIVPPMENYFRLAIDGVASTSVTQSDKGTVYSLTVVPETSTLEDPRPHHHNTAGHTLSLSSIDIPVAKITKVDFEYPGAIVTVTIDENNRVVEYSENLKLKGVGEAEIFGMTAGAEIEGYMNETWVIEWK